MIGRLVTAALTMTWVALCMPAHAAGASKDCRLRSAAQLPMQITPDGRVTIPVRLDGHDYRFMVDTGGFINTVSHRVVAEEGYEPKVSYGTRLRGMGTSYLSDYVTAKEFIMGHSRGEGFKFFVDDFNVLSWDGTLAPEILAAYDLDLDFGHDKFNLFSPDHCPGAIVYWTDAPVAVVPIEIQNRTHIRIPVMIDGKKIMATLDTGAVGAAITQRAAERYLGIARDDPALKALGSRVINHMSAPVFNYPFKALSFGDIEVANPNIQIIADSFWNDDDLLLGVNILRQLHVYIAYGERKMYLTPALAGKTAN